VVEPVLFGASVSAVNYSEVLKKAVEKRGSIQQARYFLERQSINVVPFDESQGVLAASILPKTSPYGLSFAQSPILQRQGPHCKPSSVRQKKRLPHSRCL
jgi:PIN domain nuclease of toxin-antitoxin system